MGNPEVIDKYVSYKAASDILCRALSHWNITYHYIKKGADVSELNLEDPDNGDVMEILFHNDRIWEITVTTDADILVYSVEEKEEKDNA